MIWNNATVGCVADYEGLSQMTFFENNNNSAYNTMPITDDNVGNSVTEHNNENIDIYYNAGLAGALSFKYLYYINYSINQQIFNSKELIYTAGGKTSHIFPDSVYTSPAGRKFLFVIMRNWEDSFWDVTDFTLHYFEKINNNWQGPIRVTTAPDYITEVSSYEENGKLHFVWFQNGYHDSNLGTTIYTSFDGNNWSIPETIEINTKQASFYTLRVKNGIPYFMYKDYNQETYDSFYYLTYKQNNQWIEPKQFTDGLFPSKSRIWSYPSFEIDDAGILHLVLAESNKGIYYTQYNQEKWLDKILIYEGDLSGHSQTIRDPRILIVNDEISIVLANKVWESYGTSSGVWKNSYIKKLTIIK